MSDLATPEEFSAELSGARLSIVGEVMLDVLAKATSATSTIYDCAYSRAVLPWAWIKNALLLLARSKEHDWLKIRHAGNDLVIGIGNFPVRFFIDDHANPRKARVLSPTEGEACQLPLDFGTQPDTVPALWRFIVERALVEEDENKVFFVGYNVLGEIVAKWQFTESVRAFHTTDNEVPAAAQLDPISLSPIYDNEQGGEVLEDMGHPTSGENNEHRAN